MDRPYANRLSSKSQIPSKTSRPSTPQRKVEPPKTLDIKETTTTNKVKNEVVEVLPEPEIRIEPSMVEDDKPIENAQTDDIEQQLDEELVRSVVLETPKSPGTRPSMELSKEMASALKVLDDNLR